MEITLRITQVNENHFEKLVKKTHLHMQNEIKKDEGNFQNDNNQNEILKVLTT